MEEKKHEQKKLTIESITREYNSIIRLEDSDIELANIKFPHVIDNIDTLLKNYESFCLNILFREDAYMYNDASSKLKEKIEKYVFDYNQNKNEYILNVLTDIRIARQKPKKSRGFISMMFKSKVTQNEDYKDIIDEGFEVLRGAKKAKYMTNLYLAFINLITRIDWYQKHVNPNCLNKNEVFRNFEEKFIIAFNDSNIDNMEELINNVNMEIFKIFKEYLKPNKKGGFHFIGHSTNSAYGIEKNYTSCSLFTEECMDTYNEKCGYIVDDDIKYDGDENVILASSGRDMNTNNVAIDATDAFINGEIPLLQFPEKMISECIGRKKSNPHFDVYNEIAIKNPKFKKIFCFTTGALSLDPNYNLAEELHKNTGLSIWYYDILRLNKDKRIDCIKYGLIKQCANKLNISSDLISKKKLFLFNDFFIKFDELKNSKYNEKDILTLFLSEYYKIIMNIVNKDSMIDEEIKTLEYHR